MEIAIERLRTDPLAQTRNMKSLRPNSVAERELRIFGRYRVLFIVDRRAHLVDVVAIGEKRNVALLIRGKEHKLE
jgi:hypothetical protein